MVPWYVHTQLQNPLPIEGRRTDESVRRISRGKSVVVGIVAALVLAVVAVAGTATAGRTADKTLTIWTYDNQDPGLKPVLTQLSKNFEKSHPGVKINILFKEFNAVLATVGRALQSDSGPDLTEGNQGFQTDGALVKAKLILPLDKYAAKYNWVKLLGPGTTQQYRGSADGKKFGVGSTYGVAQDGTARRPLLQQGEAEATRHQLRERPSRASAGSRRRSQRHGQSFRPMSLS